METESQTDSAVGLREGFTRESWEAFEQRLKDAVYGTVRTTPSPPPTPSTSPTPFHEAPYIFPKNYTTRYREAEGGEELLQATTPKFFVENRQESKSDDTVGDGWFKKEYHRLKDFMDNVGQSQNQPESNKEGIINKFTDVIKNDLTDGMRSANEDGMKEKISKLIQENISKESGDIDQRLGSIAKMAQNKDTLVKLDNMNPFLTKMSPEQIQEIENKDPNLGTKQEPQTDPYNKHPRIESDYKEGEWISKKVPSKTFREFSKINKERVGNEPVMVEYNDVNVPEEKTYKNPTFIDPKLLDMNSIVNELKTVPNYLLNKAGDISKALNERTSTDQLIGEPQTETVGCSKESEEIPIIINPAYGGGKYYNNNYREATKEEIEKAAKKIFTPFPPFKLLGSPRENPQQNEDNGPNQSEPTNAGIVGSWNEAPVLFPSSALIPANPSAKLVEVDENAQNLPPRIFPSLNNKEVVGIPNEIAPPNIFPPSRSIDENNTNHTLVKIDENVSNLPPRVFPPAIINREVVGSPNEMPPPNEFASFRSTDEDNTSNLPLKISNQDEVGIPNLNEPPNIFPTFRTIDTDNTKHTLVDIDASATNLPPKVFPDTHTVGEAAPNSPKSAMNIQENISENRAINENPFENLPANINSRTQAEMLGSRMDWSSNSNEHQPNINEFQHLGKIIPATGSRFIEHKDNEQDRKHKMFFVGEGVKFPVNMKHQHDGSVHLSFDVDKLCNCKDCQNDKNIAALKSRFSNAAQLESSPSNPIAVAKRSPVIPHLPRRIQRESSSAELIPVFNDIHENNERSGEDNDLKYRFDNKESSENKRDHIQRRISLVKDMLSWMKNLVVDESNKN